MTWAARILTLCACSMLWAAGAQAHTGALAAFELRGSGTQVLAAWSAQDFASQGGLLAPTLSGCASEAAGVWTCPEDLVGVEVLAPDLSGRDGQIVVSVMRGDTVVRGVLDPRSTRWAVPPVGAKSAALGEYFARGVAHIASGFDHLVFVLGLLLLVPSARALLGVVTAFTVGHSLTLGVATLTGIAPASAPTEALIAGSILLLARELVVAGRHQRTGRHPAGLAVVFGLAHGFGFSGALAEVGVPAGEMGRALLGFNLGVEAGQLGFVAAAGAVGWLLSAMRPALLESARTSLPWAIGALAGFWFVARLVELGA